MSVMEPVRVYEFLKEEDLECKKRELVEHMAKNPRPNFSQYTLSLMAFPLECNSKHAEKMLRTMEREYKLPPVLEIVRDV